MHYRSIDDASARRPSDALPTTPPEAAQLAASLERYAAALRARGRRGPVRLRLDADAVGRAGWVSAMDATAQQGREWVKR